MTKANPAFTWMVPYLQIHYNNWRLMKMLNSYCRHCSLHDNLVMCNQQLLCWLQDYLVTCNQQLLCWLQDYLVTCSQQLLWVSAQIDNQFGGNQSDIFLNRCWFLGVIMENQEWKHHPPLLCDAIPCNYHILVVTSNDRYMSDKLFHKHNHDFRQSEELLSLIHEHIITNNLQNNV